MRLDQPLYLVISELACGPIILEVELSSMDHATVCKDIRDGQYEAVLAVLRLDPVAQTCREVTHEFKDLIPE